ncbi:hypothetical protein CIPAW_15G141400 [Carya illinoinensis]|uniref:EGF-like domain-containing protein n=1 Tax=Carya illinoinensis TaxID=32201 RepID=A0A8T1NF53_CARIL|nr:hypothetical protein CIPAW_15G141400 [Carya illinoinensis]
MRRCQENTTGYTCKANRECQNSTNGPGYHCHCSSGYDRNPYLSNGCQDIDECKASNPCVEKAACINHVGYFNCSCPEGYEGDGRREGTCCSPKPSNSGTIIITLGITISLLVLLLGGSSLLLGLKRKKLVRLKEKFFQQNGGFMLQKQISNRGMLKGPRFLIRIK